MRGDRAPAAGKRALGFTLMELLITVAVIALLAAVAYPSYQKQIQTARRSEAKAALTEVAQRLERFYTENNTYVGACLAGQTGCTASTKVYEGVSENGHYLLDLPGSSRTASTYLITATPQGGQAGDACGTLTLNEKGERRLLSGGDWQSCW